MSMMDITAESLSKSVEAEVPEMYVVIAKNSVVGINDSQMCDLLGVTKEQLSEVTQDPVYKAVRIHIASEYARESVETDFSWDAVETAALKTLTKKVGFIQDTDQVLRIAAIANKAQRRHQANAKNILDPSAANQRVGLSLTRRITERLADGTTRVAEEIRQVSVIDGSAVQPAFDEIESALRAPARPRIPDNFAIRTHEPDFGIDDLVYKG